jgi:hypothetical protein
MAISRRFSIQHETAFPKGAFLRGEVEPVADFQAEQLPDGSRPQQRDKESGLPLWQCTVIDMDEDAGRKDIGVSVKFVASKMPEVPKNNTPFPWTPVRFEGLTALPYVDDSGNRARIAWSFRAERMAVAHNTGKAEQDAA